MEIKNIIIGLGLAFVIAFAFNAWITNLNKAYVPIGGQEIDSGFYNDFKDINEYLTGVSTGAGEGYQNDTGITSSDKDSASQQSLRAFNAVKSLVGFIPKMIENTGTYLGIPKEYTTIARYIFVILFILLIAYLIYLGASKFSV